MTKVFEVLDLRPECSGIRTPIEAHSPEAAGKQLLGVELVRSGLPRNAVAKVYWQNPNEALNVVRLYTRVENARQR